MTKLNDYSGEFLPDLKLNDFSHETLVDLLTLYSKLYVALDGYWYLTVKERFGNEEALACDTSTALIVSNYEVAHIAKRLNIQGDDVIALMKALQLTPWQQLSQSRIEVKNRNDAVLTNTYCPVLDALEREGEGREDEICNTVCRKTFEVNASLFNPHMLVTCLASPPRKSKDEICCQWEFTCDK